MLEQYVGSGSTYETIMIDIAHAVTLIFVSMIVFLILNLGKWR